jgi:hypothetical protein
MRAVRWWCIPSPPPSSRWYKNNLPRDPGPFFLLFPHLAEPVTPLPLIKLFYLIPSTCSAWTLPPRMQGPRSSGNTIWITGWLGTSGWPQDEGWLTREATLWLEGWKFQFYSTLQPGTKRSWNDKLVFLQWNIHWQAWKARFKVPPESWIHGGACKEVLERRHRSLAPLPIPSLAISHLCPLWCPLQLMGKCKPHASLSSVCCFSGLINP